MTRQPRPGDIILTARGQGIFARLIVWGQSLWDGRPGHFQHAMRYLGDGLCLSQEWRAVVKPLEAWAGQTIRVWSNPGYTGYARKRLVTESRLAEGRGYDWLGILGQALRVVPFAGKLLARINAPWATYCSELVATTEQVIFPGFMDGKTQVSPQDINDWCNRHDWESRTLLPGGGDFRN